MRINEQSNSNLQYLLQFDNKCVDIKFAFYCYAFEGYGTQYKDTFIFNH